MRALLSLVACTALIACVSPHAQREPALDPSSPNAAESKPLDAPTPLAPASAAEAPPKPASAPTTYVCPMHPDVTSDAPGRCPKCGMALVPKKPEAAPSGQKHHHDASGGEHP